MTRFALPLVQGGAVHVGRPVDADDLAQLCADASVGMNDPRIDSARAAVAAELWLEPVATLWDETAVRLAVGVHNLLFLGHPDARSWTVSRAALALLVETTRRALAIPPPRTPAEAVARHTLVGRVVELTRVDVRLDCWAAVYHFRGQEPPARLVRWPRLRRVREERRSVVWLEQDLSEAELGLFEQLLRASPLTDLLSPERPRPPFGWLVVAPYLRQPGIARLVCHRFLARGLDRVGPPLARAFWALAAADPSPAGAEALRLAAGLVGYLYAVECLVAEPALKRDDSPAETTDWLPSVLFASAALPGLLPDGEALGDTQLAARLGALVAAARLNAGAGAEALTRRLQAALAAAADAPAPRSLTG